MTWKPPQTEEDWNEVLSRYLDDDLTPEERVELERVVFQDAHRMEQLHQMRQASSFLKTWEVEVPSPDPAFLRDFHQRMENASSSWQDWRSLFFNFYRVQWGTFASGMVVGIFLMFFLLPSMMQAPNVDQAAKTPPVMNVYISPSQAESLLQEVKAEGMVHTLRSLVHDREWSEAKTVYHTLSTRYKGTKAARELKNDPMAQTYIKHIMNSNDV